MNFFRKISSPPPAVVLGVAPAAKTDAVAAIAPAAAPGVAPAAPVPETKAAAAAEVGHDTQAALTETVAGQQRDALRKALEGQLNTLINPLKLVDKTFSGNVPGDLNFLNDSNKSELRAEVLEQLKGLNLDNIGEFAKTYMRDVPVDEAKNLIAEVFVVDSLKEIETKFKTQYGEHFEAFVKANPSYKLMYDLKIDRFGKRNVAFVSSPDDFDAKYKKFAEENATDKKTEQAKTPEAAEAEADEIARAKAIENSFLGGLLKTLGIVEVDKTTGKADFREVVNGGNWFGALVVGLFGGGDLLNNKKAYSEMVDSLGEKYKPMLKGIEEKARRSPFALKDKKPTAPVDAAQGEGEPYDEVDDDKFALFVAKSETPPEKGVKLNEDYVVEPGKILKADLNLAEVIIPKGKTLSLEGETDQTATADNITIKGRELKIKDKVPAGIVFTGKPVFELV